ncbi:MAG: DUF4230 domain-containing protein [Parasphingorhabdus sp.]|nr:DUF4230 domain-containing protein [Parasphingorhabdus sp.]
MAPNCMKRIGSAFVLLGLAAILAIMVLLWPLAQSWFGPRADPETIAAASLSGLREQNRLVPFTARFVAVVTSSETRFGLSAKKTLILPGNMRYELDLAQLKKDDLSWDAQQNRLTVNLPPIAIAGPEFDLNAMSEFREGKIILSLTDAEARIDNANRAAAIKQMRDDARSPVMMRLARNAARKAIEASFAMPLRAAGLDASVEARFAADTSEVNNARIERSRNIPEVLAEQRQKREQAQ